MSRSILFRLVALAVAGLLVASGVSACGDDDSSGSPEPAATPASTPAPTEAPATPEPEPEPEPTEAPEPEPEPTEMPATPEPTPEPEPEPTEPPEMMLGNFPIDEATTGADLLSGISATESACIGELMGDGGFDQFQGTPIIEAAAMEGTYAVWADCLEFENLLSVAVGLVSYTGGGWEPSSQECIANVARDFPPLIYYAFDLTDRISEEDASVQEYGDLLGFYECLTTQEKIYFSQVMQRNPVDSFTGQDALRILASSELECMENNVSEEGLEGLFESPDIFEFFAEVVTPQDQIQFVLCLLPETITSLRSEVIVSSLGVRTPASRQCALAFIEANPTYLEDIESLPPEEFEETIGNAIELFACLTDEEVQSFVQNYLPLIVP